MITTTNYLPSKWFVKVENGRSQAQWGYFLTFPLWSIIKNKRNFTKINSKYFKQIIYNLTSELWWAYQHWSGFMFYAYIQRRIRKRNYVNPTPTKSS